MAKVISTGFEGLIQALPWFRKDFKKHEVVPDEGRWFSWGYIYDGWIGEASHRNRWYVRIALPSYSYRLSFCSDRFALHQAHLVYTAPLSGPLSENQGWRLIYIELP